MENPFDDPRLTAHAAGEPDPGMAAQLDDPAREAERREVETLRAFMDELRDALDENDKQLDALRKAALLQAAAQPAPSGPESHSPTPSAPDPELLRRLEPLPMKTSWFTLKRALAAASVLLVAGLLYSVLIFGESPSNHETFKSQFTDLDANRAIPSAVNEAEALPAEPARTASEEKSRLRNDSGLQPKDIKSELTEALSTPGNSFAGRIDLSKANIVPTGPSASPAPALGATASSSAPSAPGSFTGTSVAGSNKTEFSADAPAFATAQAPAMGGVGADADALTEIKGTGKVRIGGDVLTTYSGDGKPREQHKIGDKVVLPSLQALAPPAPSAPVHYGGAVYAASNAIGSPPPAAPAIPAPTLHGGGALLKTGDYTLDLTLGDRVSLANDTPVFKAEAENAPAVDPSTGYVLPSPPPPPAVPSPADRFDPFTENGFVPASVTPFSTFAIEADTAAYSLVRRLVQSGQRPPRAAVRLEELINYFPYDYAPPADSKNAFAVHSEIAPAPWNPSNHLLKIGIKGKTFPKDARPGYNLTFLVDVSGSMAGPDRLDLVIYGLKRLAEQLDARDRISLVTYASGTRVVAENVPGDQKPQIMEMLGALRAAGSTFGQGGIQLAYATAKKNLEPGMVNRVILCTDGDFNVGVVDRGELGRLVETEAKNHIFLSVLGFGMGNHRDDMLEMLSRKGHGNHAYIDDEAEARKALVDQMLGTLVTIAKDVKIQVEFNPATVASYRLLGYENRLMAREDFDNDAKAGGDIGAGHTVTALYELVPAKAGDGAAKTAAGAASRYQQAPALTEQAMAGEYGLVRIRDKTPTGDISRLREFPIPTSRFSETPGPDFQFAASVAAWGMILRDSQYKGKATWPAIVEWAESGIGDDPNGYRREFVELVKRSRELR